MKTSKVVWVVLSLIVIGGAGWFLISHNKASTMPVGEASIASTTAEISGDNLALGQNSTASLGNFLVAYNGMTLYTYKPDTAGVSNCTGECAANWPPYVVTSNSNLVAESPVAGTVSTITRSDTHTLQVTYEGHPLYFFKGDTSPNDAKGEGLDGTWSIVKP